MGIALIVTTYDRPDALAPVLESIASQSEAPDELIIADDGSGEATRAVIEDFAERWSHPCTHVWQDHAGFGAAQARNRAIARAHADYVILADGDMVLDSRFIADHRAAARRGWFIQGTRIRLSAARTARILAGDLRLPGPFGRGIGGLRRCYALHSRLGARAMRRLANTFVAIKACNQGFWRSDLLRVNGFDATMTGWGYEDKELCARLVHAGVRRGTLLFGAIAYHLHHTAADRTSVADNRATYERTLAERRLRADHGIVPADDDAGPTRSGR